MIKLIKYFASILAVTLLLPALAFTVYLLFLWLSYIDETINSGNKYGFTIGTTTQQIYKDISAAKVKHPELMLYISYGPRAGDNMTLPPTKANFETALKSEFWELLLDGEGEFFNIIKLKVENNKLSRIHRHRKYFEIP